MEIMIRFIYIISVMYFCDAAELIIDDYKYAIGKL